MEIKGKVTDLSGEPLMGANLFYSDPDGTKWGTATNENGEYVLEVDALQPINISYIGYNTRKITAKDMDKATIILVENIEQLGEVVITAKKPITAKKVANQKIYYIIGASAGILATALLIYKYKK